MKRLITIAAFLVAAVGAFAAPSVAAPLDVAVAPRVAPTATPVEITGSGCTSDVRITVTQYLFPGTPTLVQDLLVSPDAGGAWQAGFPMPAEPAYVIAECDSVATTPIVVAPTEPAYTGSALVEVTPTELVLSATSLIDGTEFAIFDLAGTLLGSTTVAGSTAEVRLPRSLGAQHVLGLSVSIPVNTGLPDPFVPLVRDYSLPLRADTTIAVDPRVSAAGATVSAAGTCAGTPRFLVVGGTSGWFDVATVFVDETPTAGPDDTWSTTFVMPASVASAAVLCSDGSATGGASLVVSAATGGDELSVSDPDATATTIVFDAPPESSGPYEAFTSTGEPLQLTVDGFLLQVEIPERPVQVVVLGTVVFGENAEANQVQSVASWYFDVAAAQVTTTTTTSSTTTTSAPPPPTTAPPTTAPPTTVAIAPTVLSADLTLPATGMSTEPLVVSGLALVVAGVAVLGVGVRRRRH